MRDQVNAEMCCDDDDNDSENRHIFPFFLYDKWIHSVSTSNFWQNYEILYERMTKKKVKEQCHISHPPH